MTATSHMLTSATFDAPAIMARDAEYVMGTYSRLPRVFVRGEGMRLWDAEGREYLDFLSGIAVCGVGHCHPRVARAIAEQAATLMHTSNLFHTPLQAMLARRLCEYTCMDRAFFCNSGTEANEAAIKIARKWGRQKRGEGCIEILTFTGSFHGRTFGSLSATANLRYQEPFGAMLPGFRHLPLGDLAALDDALTENVCAVMIEPIQGESGVHVVDAAFLEAVRALCDESEVLMICDEVQCGLGRTGTFLAAAHARIAPDIVTLAKSIADGLPMGACLARGEAARTLVPGDHGTTFGGQPLACAAALAVLDVLEDENLMENAAHVGACFLDALHSLHIALPDKIREARGIGLMVGLELRVPAAKTIQSAMLERGIILNATNDYTLRFLPPLLVTEADCDRVTTALRDLLTAL